MLHKPYLVIFLLLLCSAVYCNFQEEKEVYNATFIPFNETVYTICKDTYGKYWLGTNIGLRMWDGNNIHQWNFHANGKRERFMVKALHIVDSILWVGTGKGLYKFNLTNSRYTLFDESYRPNVLNISSDRHKNIWVAADEESILLPDNGNGYNKHKKFLDLSEKLKTPNGNNRPVRNVVFLGDTAFVSSFRTVFKLLSLPGGNCHNLGEIYNIDKGYIQKTLVKDNYFYFVSTFFLGRLNTNDFKPPAIFDFTHYPEIQGTGDFIVNKNKQIILATNNGGVLLNQPFTDSVALKEIELVDRETKINKTNKIFVLYPDNNENLIIGTRFNGFCVVPKKTVLVEYITEPFVKLSNQTTNNIITSLVYEYNKLWASTLNSGIVRIDENNKFDMLNSSSVDNPINNNHVFKLCSDNLNRIWIKDWKDIGYIDASTLAYNKILPNSNAGTHIACDFLNRLWVCKDGVKIINDQGGIIHNFDPNSKDYPFGHDFISGILKDNYRNGFFITTQKGIDYVLLDSIGEIMSVSHIPQKYPNTNNYTNDIVRSITQVSDSVLYAVVNVTFLNKIVFNKNTGHYKVKCLQPMFNSAINVFHYNHRLWVTDDKIYVYNYNGEDLILEQILDMVPKDCNLTRAITTNTQGCMYIGTSNGILKLYTDSLVHNNCNSSIFISQLLVNGQRVLPGEHSKKSPILLQNVGLQNKFNLKHNENTISFQFGITNPAHSNIAWCYYMCAKRKWFLKQEKWEKLLIKETPWITLNNLGPGKYNLLFKRGSLKTLEEPKPITFRVKRPVMGSIVSIVMYIIIFFSFVYAIYLMVVKKVEVQNKLMANEQLSDQKIQLLINLTHMLRTPLMLVGKPLDQLASRAHGKEVKNDLDFVRLQTQKMLSSLNEIIDFRKTPDNNSAVTYDNVCSIVERCTYIMQGLAKNKKITLQFNAPEMHPIGTVNKQVVQRVVANALQYIIQKVPSESIIHISMLINEKQHFNALKPLFPVKQIEKKWDNIITMNFSGSNINERELKRCKKTNKNRILGTFSFISSLCNLLNQIGGEIQCFITANKNLELALMFDNSKQKVYKAPELHNKTVIEQLNNIKTETNNSILIVVNDIDLRLLIKNTIACFACTIEAGDGELAMEKIKQNTPDLIICDWILPKKDGLEFISEIKEQVDYIHIPVIMISDKNQCEHLNQATIAGADYFIAKPFDIEYLQNLILNILRKRAVFVQKIKNSTVKTPEYNITNYQHKQFLAQVNNLIVQNLKDPDLKYNQLAKHLNISNSVLFRKMKELTGKTPGEYIKDKKIEHAANILTLKGTSVSETAFLSGFKSLSSFSEEFKKRYGVCPSSYKNRHILD